MLLLGVHVSKEPIDCCCGETDNDNSNNYILAENKKKNTIEEAIKRDIKIYDLNSVQIFVHNPRGYHPLDLNIEKILKATENIYVYVHTSYPSVNIWKISENPDSASSKQAIGQLLSQLNLCNEIRAEGLVLHINKIKPELLINTMKIIKSKVKKTGVKLLLEMIASKPSQKEFDLTYETSEKINYINKKLGKSEWWGWTVDTAHIWAAGIDIKSYKNMKKWLDDIENKNSIKLFHLNGSYSEKGSGKDKHAVIFDPEDQIWSNIEPNKSGVKAVVEFCFAREIPMIMEINRGNSIKNAIKQIKLLVD
jgi:hypothetical protein